MPRRDMAKVSGLLIAVFALSLIGAVAATAADEYIVPRTPTDDRDRGGLRYVDNFFSGITGFADNGLDLVAAAAGLILDTGGQITLLVSDVGGLVDDNALTRTFFHGFVSTNLAESALVMSIAGTQLMEINHDLNINQWPPRREWYLRADDNDDGYQFNYIDYFHCRGGYACLWTLPVRATAFLISDGIVRPVGNVLRVFSISESDDLEAWGLGLIEKSILLCGPDVPDEARIVEVPVVEIREVPVETEVVREVFRTVTTMNFTFRDVLFELDSAELTPMGQRVCDQIADVLGGVDVTEMVVTGHTCDRGSDEYNMDLGQRRADSVAAALAERGLDRSVMETVSMGESDPIVPNENETLRSINRRVEVRVTYVEETM